jgi:hypothetical protein
MEPSMTYDPFDSAAVLQHVFKRLDAEAPGRFQIKEGFRPVIVPVAGPQIHIYPQKGEFGRRIERVAVDAVLGYGKRLPGTVKLWRAPISLVDGYFDVKKVIKRIDIMIEARKEFDAQAATIQQKHEEREAQKVQDEKRAQIVLMLLSKRLEANKLPFQRFYGNTATIKLGNGIEVEVKTFATGIVATNVCIPHPDGGFNADDLMTLISNLVNVKIPKQEG